MRIKFLEQWKYRLSGRSVPVIRVKDIDCAGMVKSLEIVRGMKDRPNSLVDGWDVKGYEKDPAYGPIEVINEKGVREFRWVVSPIGKTVGLFTQMSAFPNREDIIGKRAEMDDIADSMDLGKSIKQMAIGLIIGIFIGWLFISPIMGSMLK